MRPDNNWFEHLRNDLRAADAGFGPISQRTPREENKRDFRVIAQCEHAAVDSPVLCGHPKYIR